MTLFFKAGLGGRLLKVGGKRERNLLISGSYIVSPRADPPITLSILATLSPASLLWLPYPGVSDSPGKYPMVSEEQRGPHQPSRDDVKHSGQQSFNPELST